MSDECAMTQTLYAGPFRVEVTIPGQKGDAPWAAVAKLTLEVEYDHGRVRAEYKAPEGGAR